MSNQDIEGTVPADEAPGAPPGTPEYFEQQLAKERDARALMRDRLRHTEALAAESHALRARMAEELERVTADRDRLRTTAASDPALEATVPLRAPAAPPMTPRAADWPLKPPAPPPRRNGPWRALAMLGGLAAVVGVAAWFTGSLPGMPGPGVRTAHEMPAGSTAAPAPVARATPPAASTAIAIAAAPAPADMPSGAVALPPLTPEAQLAAAPTAAGPVTPARPAGMAGRLRKALQGEGIGAAVEVDAASGHVLVADPQSDSALRERTDMLIRAVYAGASLPEPQIEHRWLSPMRAATAASAATPEPVPAPPSGMTAAQAYAARHAAPDASVEHHAKRAGASTVAEAEELRPVLPEGRITANCRTSLAGRTAHRADMTACMKTSCCRAGAGQSEDCRAYQKAYAFTCGAG